MGIGLYLASLESLVVKWERLSQIGDQVERRDVCECVCVIFLKKVYEYMPD